MAGTDYVSIDGMSERILRDMGQYTDEVVSRSRQEAIAVRNAMKPMLEAASPIRHYSTNTQTVRRIVVHRNPPSVPKAVKEIKAAKYQPGYFKVGWNYGNIKAGRNREIYGVKNKNMPTVVHLVNFTHDIVAHGMRYINAAHGSNLVDNVQNWGARELERRLSEFLERR